MRKLVIITAYSPTIPVNCLRLSEEKSESSVAFSNARCLLGQEFPCAIYDMRSKQGVSLHLEALAIVAGTISANGTLFLICPNWENLANCLDNDSLRWHSSLIVTPNFYRHFKQLVREFKFEVVSDFPACLPSSSGHFCSKNCNLTAEQADIFAKLPTHYADVHLITAPRGRGKSTLAGKLADLLAQTENVIITARSQASLPQFWQQTLSHLNLRFIAPDKLVQLIENQEISYDSWLFVDEAASLPLPMLRHFCHTFRKLVLSTTTYHYEGTGRGFSLKLPTQIKRTLAHWQLTEPLRFSKNDPLEQFIHRLLLLEDDLNPNPDSLSCFYQLLAYAHYKTTPTDLRRLFDAADQHLYKSIDEQQLQGGIWAISEGGISEELTQAIWRGERRPQGNLVAQYLCFQGNLPKACQLQSIRISRLAVQPHLQRQGIGKRLVSQFILQKKREKRPLDFISVSFGLSIELFAFWQHCGFHLVQITPTAEASSGHHSAIMLYPISEQGNIFVEQAKKRWQRDCWLLPFAQKFVDFLPPKNLSHTVLNEADWQNIIGFAYAKRTLSSCYASLYRLNKYQPIHGFLADNQKTYSKDELTKLRLHIQKRLPSEIAANRSS